MSQTLEQIAKAFADETASLREQFAAAETQRDKVSAALADETASHERTRLAAAESRTERVDRAAKLQAALTSSQAECAQLIADKLSVQDRAEAAKYAAATASAELSSFQARVCDEFAPVLGRHGVDVAGLSAEEILRRAAHLLDVRRDAPIEALRKHLNQAQRMRNGGE